MRTIANRMDSARATIRDVSSVASVSPATVSRVLNGTGYVAPAKVARVVAAVRALSYRPNGTARNLRRQVAPFWALVLSLPDVQSSQFASFVRGAESVAREQGRSLVLFDSNRDPAEEANCLAAIGAERMAGAIISPIGAERNVAQLIDQGVPVVTIDRRLHGVSTSAVLVNNVAAGRRATARLLEAGYRRVACVTGSKRVSTTVERLDGYRQALAERSIPFEPALVCMENRHENLGYRAAQVLMALSEPPDAVVVTDGLLTVGVLRALQDQSRLRLDEIGIVGFDADPWAQVAYPPLIAVAQPAEEVGRTAAELLVSGGASAVRVLDSRIIVRHDSAALRSKPDATDRGRP